MDGRSWPFGIDSERVLAFIRRRIPASDDPMDLLQDVFLALVSRWNMGEKIENAMAWVLTVAARRAVDALRRRSRGEVSLDAGIEGTAASDIMDLADASAASESEAMEREELRGAIEDAISELPAEQREVFLMHEVEGLSFKEIAARTGAPLGTLLARKRYAVAKLRETVSRKIGTRKED